MAIAEHAETYATSWLPFLDRTRTIARPGYSRWMVPPAALCLHLCIGQAYAFSVFNLPMTKLLGISQSTPGDWKLTELGWIFSIAMLFLGLSSAVFGRWVEEGGPRKAMFTAGVCWASGFMISALGIHLHNLWLIYVGYGVIGGCALGIGYISPVSTLMKWFPDRPGMATGMAIMGFGGGALIASPLSVWLMSKFSSSSDVGVFNTFIVLGCVYFCFMMFGALVVRVPAPGWKPAGYVPATAATKLITRNDVYVYDAVKTPQFWLIWVVLFVNTTAGIGVLGQASAMSQEMFPGQITPIAAAGLVGLMSLFNMGGRFSWASLSDYIGRKNTYFVYMTLGFAMYLTVPYAGGSGNIVLFVICFLVIVSMYGGGLFHGSGLSPRHVRHPLRRRDPRNLVDGMVRCRDRRSGADQLHPRVQRDAWCAESAGLQCDDVHHGRTVRGRLHCKPLHQGRRQASPHGERRRS